MSNQHPHVGNVRKALGSGMNWKFIWFDFEDVLPEIGDEILILYQRKDGSKCRYVSKLTSYHEENRNIPKNWLAWMPLPEVDL